MRALPIALMLLAASSARATQCQAIAGGSPTLAAIDAETRIRYLDHRFHREAAFGRIWSGTWGGIYGALTIGQLALLSSANTAADKAQNIVGASAAFIGVLAISIIPLSIEMDQIHWRKELARSTPQDNQCALLADAERILLRGADSEEFGISPLVHVGNFAINVAAGMIVGLGYQRWDLAAAITFPGIAVGEVQVITQPVGLIEDLRRYRAGDLGPRETRWLGRFAVAPMVGRDHSGLMLAGSF
jgi:hypothetical protein